MKKTLVLFPQFNLYEIPHLYVAVEADRGHEHTLHILEGHWAVLFFVDEKCKRVFHQVQ